MKPVQHMVMVAVSLFLIALNTRYTKIALSIGAAVIYIYMMFSIYRIFSIVVAQ